LFENKFFLLLVNFLWMVGLFGVLFTIAYAIQYRRQRWWNVGYSNNVPRTLAPLYLTLATLCAGLLLHAYAAPYQLARWIAVVWGLLALIFFVRGVAALIAAARAGWDAPTVEDAPAYGWRRFATWPLMALLLLLVNVALLGWMGNQRLNADATALVPPASSAAAALVPYQQPVTVTVAITQPLIPRVNLKVTLTPTATVAITTTPNLVLPPTPSRALDDLPAIAIVTLAPADLPTASGSLPAATAATPAPGLPATPAPEQSQLTAVVQSPYGANLRAAPVTTAPIVTLLEDKSVLTLLGRTNDNSWYLVRLPDATEGWVAGQLLTVSAEAVIDLPVTAP
jgi:hypothetical protein